jgi:hypothetical protein
MTRHPTPTEPQTDSPTAAAPAPETFFGAFEDDEIELALKTVGPDPRDLAQFLRSCRAQ